MADLEILYKFLVVTRIVIDRSGTSGAVSLELTCKNDGALVTLKFDRPSELDTVSELMDVDSVIVSREIASFREFGTVKVEYGSIEDGWYEFWCDSVQELSCQKTDNQ